MKDHVFPQNSAPREGAPAESSNHRISRVRSGVLLIEQFFDNLGNTLPPGTARSNRAQRARTPNDKRGETSEPRHDNETFSAYCAFSALFPALAIAWAAEQVLKALRAHKAHTSPRAR